MIRPQTSWTSETHSGCCSELKLTLLLLLLGLAEFNCFIISTDTCSNHSFIQACSRNLGVGYTWGNNILKISRKHIISFGQYVHAIHRVLKWCMSIAFSMKYLWFYKNQLKANDCEKVYHMKIILLITPPITFSLQQPFRPFVVQESLYTDPCWVLGMKGINSWCSSLPIVKAAIVTTVTLNTGLWLIIQHDIQRSSTSKPQWYFKNTGLWAIQLLLFTGEP